MGLTHSTLPGNVDTDMHIRLFFSVTVHSFVT